ncbi:ArgE/DapE family deacylase [Secundilactobacillus folii]|uniref:Probable succinyl-diaminopimelate desuccinylase n=1 Tax=Secundilactobacillus folii TaxID=2678357 RepID=A0A7X3C3P8_9LACO|nr:ArgE/DapE family deacylase [Secundilactobacillus folii]MTV82742.1 ArgE/DapE family deacylase [Secundilactobacillus folii]
MSDDFKMSAAQKVKILSDLVAFKSVNDHEIDVAKYIQNLLKQYDIEAKILPITDTRADLVAEIGSGHPVLGVSGHMDVVATGDETKWHTDPFKLTKKDGQLYGRGAADMKSGLAALVIALIEIKTNRLLKQGTIRLMATMGEEVGELGSRKFADEGYMNDVDALVIGEPSGYDVAYAHKGSMDLRLSSAGKAAHSSMPEQGYNAIDPLLDLLVKANQAFRETDKKSALLGQLTFNTTIFNGGDQVNSIPESASAEINVRTVPEFNNDAVKKQMEALVDQQNSRGAKISLDIYMSQPAIETTGDSFLISLIKEIGNHYAENPVKAVPLPAVTDASNLLHGKGKDFPLAIFGPGSNSVHQVDEYVSQQMFLNFTDIYVELFSRYLNESN